MTYSIYLASEYHEEFEWDVSLYYEQNYRAFVLKHAHILLISKRSGCLTIGSVRLQVGCSHQPSVDIWEKCVTGIS